MQRGVLTLNRNELNSLLVILDINIFSNTQLFEKLNSALQSTDEEVKIFVSEDEIEKILDEVGPPINDNQSVNSAIQKISNLLVTLRPQSTI